MGTDKSFVLLNGKPLLQHVIERVSELKLPVILIANEHEKFAEFGLPVFADIIPNAGSLGGIYTALRQGDDEHPRTLCVACDMPFLNPRLLRTLIEQSLTFDAVVPFVDGTAHGLHAVYSSSCLPIMQKQIESGDLTIQRVFPQVKTQFVGEQALRSFDPDLRSLVNLNTPTDLDFHRAI
jgi:molybdopterin-guanine dinucleotide biosynthesis protein A